MMQCALNIWEGIIESIVKEQVCVSYKQFKFNLGWLTTDSLSSLVDGRPLASQHC